MIADLSVLQRDVIHSAGGAPHSAGDLGALKGRTGSSGTGNSPLGVAQNHFAVGTDVNEQGQILLLVEPGGNHTSHGVTAHKPGDIGKHPDFTAGRQPLIGVQFHCFVYCGHIGRRNQRGRVNAQKQVVHGGVAHYCADRDFFRCDSGLLCHFPGQLSQGLDNAPLHLFTALVQNLLNPGDYIGAILTLGVHGAGGGQLRAGHAVQKVGNQCGGSDVKGKDILVRAVGLGFHTQGIGENGDLLGLPQKNGHILLYLGLTGQNLGAIRKGNTALSAGTLTAAGGIRGQSGLNLSLKQRGALGNGDRSAAGLECYGILLHRQPPFIVGKRGRCHGIDPCQFGRYYDTSSFALLAAEAASGV